jgi:hypothetical protein
MADDQRMKLWMRLDEKLRAGSVPWPRLVVAVALLLLLVSVLIILGRSDMFLEAGCPAVVIALDLILFYRWPQAHGHPTSCGPTPHAEAGAANDNAAKGKVRMAANGRSTKATEPAQHQVGNKPRLSFLVGAKRLWGRPAFLRVGVAVAGALSVVCVMLYLQNSAAAEQRITRLHNQALNAVREQADWNYSAEEFPREKERSLFLTIEEFARECPLERNSAEWDSGLAHQWARSELVRWSSSQTKQESGLCEFTRRVELVKHAFPEYGRIWALEGQAYRMLALAATGQERQAYHAMAMYLYRMALCKDKNLAYAHNNLAMILLDQGETLSAIENAEKGLSVAKDQLRRGYRAAEQVPLFEYLDTVLQARVAHARMLDSREAQLRDLKSAESLSKELVAELEKAGKTHRLKKVQEVSDKLGRGDIPSPAEMVALQTEG